MIFKRLSFLLSVPLFVNAFTRESQKTKRDTTSLYSESIKNFPISTRAALIEKAKQLDDKIASGGKSGSYSASGWSNRLGTVLTPVSLDVYTGDRPFYWNKIDVGCRMTVIQLANGDLWVHSPVGLDKPLKEALANLGTVKYIVASNYEHLKYAPQWHKEYPAAYMWGNPGLAERLPEITWTGEIPGGTIRPEGVALENCWDFNEIVPLHLDVEVNPFTGKPFFNEVIFYHKLSKTLMVTDLYWNYPQPDGLANSHLGGSEWELAPTVPSIPPGSKFWKFGMDKVYLPFYKKFMVNNPSKYYEISKVVLDEWDVETVVPAHGDIIRGKELVRNVLEDHLKLD